MLPSAKKFQDALDQAALDSAVEEAIAEHGGDARETIRALLVSKTFLEAARNQALDWVSFGYTRGASNKERR
jgi:hypothetical protein